MSLEQTENLETATLAGGCFWCLEAVFLGLRGVTSAVSGYMGGQLPNPTYRQVCGGDTGHAEVVQVRFDRSVIAYEQILEVFFTIHDPTTPNRQGNDVGSQYRSAIFCHGPEQAAQARACIARLDQAAIWPAPIVTQVVPADVFYPAEAYHADYFARNGDEPYCQFVVAPKVAKFRRKFQAWVRE